MRIQKRPDDQPAVLSFTQERLWYFHQLEPASAVYNVPFFSRLRGPLSLPSLERALDAVIRRHEILRTVFLLVKGVPVPVVLKQRKVALGFTDLRLLRAEERHSEALRLIRAEAARAFQLSREVLLRAAVYQVGDEEFLLFHDAPHIVFEGSSLQVLYQDLSAFYNHFEAGQEPDLPALAFSYSDFAYSQRLHLAGPRLEKLEAYWKQKLTGAATLGLPLDAPRPPAQSFRGARHLSRSSPVSWQAPMRCSASSALRPTAECMRPAWCSWLRTRACPT